MPFHIRETAHRDVTLFKRLSEKNWELAYDISRWREMAAKLNLFGKESSFHVPGPRTR